VSISQYGSACGKSLRRSLLHKFGYAVGSGLLKLASEFFARRFALGSRRASQFHAGKRPLAPFCAPCANSLRKAPEELEAIVEGGAQPLPCSYKGEVGRKQESRESQGDEQDACADGIQGAGQYFCDERSGHAARPEALVNQRPYA
jgi:hypothetical protein